MARPCATAQLMRPRNEIGRREADEDESAARHVRAPRVAALSVDQRRIHARREHVDVDRVGVDLIRR